MAIGDAAAASGYEVVPAGQDLRLGYERINQKGDELAALKAIVTANAIPAGTSIEGHWAVAPAGFFMEDGSLKNRAAFPALYAAIGTRYNTGGEASTDFRLPNSQGRVGVMKGSGQFATLGARGGAESVALTQGQMPNHGHVTPQGFVGLSGGEGAGIATGSNGYTIVNNPGTTAAGNNEAHPNVQPFIVINRAIKY